MDTTRLAWSMSLIGAIDLFGEVYYDGIPFISQKQPDAASVLLGVRKTFAI